jgi:hypothetical protein
MAMRTNPPRRQDDRMRLPARAGGLALGRGSDESDHDAGVAHHRDVRAVDLDGGRVRPVDHRTLGFWGMIRSWLATRYQLGIVFHAGGPYGVTSAAIEPGRWLTAITWVGVRGRSWAKRRWKWAGSI